MLEELGGLCRGDEGIGMSRKSSVEPLDCAPGSKHIKQVYKIVPSSSKTIVSRCQRGSPVGADQFYRVIGCFLNVGH